MPKKYQENTGTSPIWVSGVLIPPGEGREVDMPDEAPALEEPVPEVDPDEALRELLAGSVGSVKAGLTGLSEATLQRLQVLEGQDAMPRKGVLEALGNALIAIADAKLKSDDLGQGNGQGQGQGGEQQPPAA